jgi:hypothetical protein
MKTHIYPHALARGTAGQLYVWPSGAPRGDPFDPPLVRAEVQAEIGGVAVVLTQPLEFRRVDPVRGELRRNVEVVPAVTVSPDTGTQIVPFSTRGTPRRIPVRVQNNSQGPVSGTLRLEVPAHTP